MTDIPPNVSTENKEPLGLDEIIYYRTDKRGFVRAGNDVFSRVTQCDQHQLAEGKFRFERHPDVPSGVTWLATELARDGQATTAYVKNKLADGGAYWALAVSLTLSASVVTVEIQPSTDLFEKVKIAYADVVKQEQERGLQPEQSAGLFEEHIRKLGYDSHADFMMKALDAEHTARVINLARKADLGVESLDEIRRASISTLDRQIVLLHDFDALQAIPNNMRIIASRLEPSGGPVSAISENYKYASTEISQRLSSFASGENNLCQAMVGIVADSVYLSRCASLIAEVLQGLKRCDADGSADEVEFLAKVEKQYEETSAEAMKHARQISGELHNSSSELRRMMLGLDTVRVMGRVESGRLGPRGVDLGATIDQLDLRHTEIARKLQELMNDAARIRALSDANSAGNKMAV